jgi:hypothetical protein
MNQTVQLIVVGLIVAAAAAFVGIRLVRTLRGRKSSCCSGGAELSRTSRTSPSSLNCGNCRGCGSH